MWGSVDDGGFGKSRFDQQSGGGFMNNTISSPSTSEKKKPERLTNVLPCTIAQIHQMPENDENLKVGSLSAKIITFVGLVHTVDVHTTKISYLVDDYSGPVIEVQLWIGETDDQTKMDNIREEQYVRVTGAIRSMKGKRHVMAFNIQPIDDFNEVTMHIAEVVHASMAVAVMDKQGESTNGGFNQSTASFSSRMDTSDTFASNSRKLSKPQQLVKQAIISCKDEQGIDLKELRNSLKSLSHQSIQEALDFLSNEGHIYTTIDEDHFKSTDCV